ncbi:hypothetical protein RS130_08535 [Paraglaciecola aquimarina]|uniref:MFS transporter n=1 Tax=Paraglaciecola aquimarina TaxID=1235557 RepID=A0ABU3SVC8_9ALTE|nr:hypothetical protein [Paraglaciecola aquimarina]MDU0353971.1 hypothetical protein [Paraglaciecola aquimarina]
MRRLIEFLLSCLTTCHDFGRIFPWSIAHLSIAAFMLVGLISTLLIRESSKAGDEPQTLRSAVVEPFKEFFQRTNRQDALWILLFIILYKLGDSMATALETPFFMDMGFSTVEIGSIAKISKTIGATVGTILGGLAMIKLGINRSLWIFGGSPDFVNIRLRDVVYGGL